MSVVGYLKQCQKASSNFFIKSIVFHHVALSWMIKTREKFEFDFDEKNHHWCKGGPWYNTTIFYNLHGPDFEYFFVTVRQYDYELMCVLHTYDNLHEKFLTK